MSFSAGSEQRNEGVRTAARLPLAGDDRRRGGDRKQVLSHSVSTLHMEPKKQGKPNKTKEPTKTPFMVSFRSTSDSWGNSPKNL